MGRSRVNPFLVALVFGAAACSAGEPSGATSVYLAIRNSSGLPVPDELRLTASGENATLVSEQRLPESGPLVPPGTGPMLGTVTLYFGTPSEVRVVVRGYVGGVMRSAGSVRVNLVRDRQIPAQVVLAPASEDNPDAAADARQDAAGADVALDGGVPDGDASEVPPSLDLGSSADVVMDALAPDITPVDGIGDTTVDTVIDAVTADAVPGDGAVPEGGGAPTCAGSNLVGVVGVPIGPVNLTAEGVLDWRHWGADGAVDHKRTAGNRISDYTPIGTGVITTRFRNAVTYSWSDGAPTLSQAQVAEGMAVSGVGNGFEIAVPAEAASRTLSVYVSGDNDTGRLAANLSDGCVPEYVMTMTNGRQSYDAVYRITFRSSTPGTQLRVNWTMTAGFEPIALFAATLY